MARAVAMAFCAALMAVAAFPALAQSDAVAKFYQGKQINLIVYSTAGSTYDVYARLLARHMGRHIPGNPSFVAQNMPGAGGLKATDYLYNIAAKDGTVFGTISRGNPFEPLIGSTKVNFDPLKFTWLGSMNREVSVAVSWHTVPVKTIDDLMKRELIIPGTGAGADSQIIPLAINNLAGTRFKIIPGYASTTRAALAMEQGEIEGIGYWSWSAIISGHPDWLRDKKLNIIFHTGAGDYAELPGVPKIRDRAKSDSDRKALDLLLAREVLGRPFVAPPDLPADRAKALKSAFIDTLKDADFLAEAKKGRVDIELVTGDEVEALLKEVFAYPKAVIAHTKDILTQIK
jgi:tripartite-type tricarboxylate transporter receptor subunit TctC